MIYMVDIIVHCKKTSKLIKTECIREVYNLNGKAIFNFLGKDKDIAAKQKLELSAFEYLDKNNRWQSLLDGFLSTPNQRKVWLKEFCEKLDTYAVDNQQLYARFKTPFHWITIYITPKKEY